MKQTNRNNDIPKEYVDINDDRIFYERRRKRYAQRRKEKRIRHAVVTGIIILLIGISISAVISGLSDKGSARTEAENSGDTSVYTIYEPSEESSAEEESSSFLSVQKKMEFNSATSNFSRAVKKELSEKILSKYVVLYDATEDKVLFQVNGNMKCYPASTTKILTAITASNILSKDTVITVGDEIEMIGEDSSIAYLQKGMKLTFEMLLDALMLPSGNDAAYTIAVNAARTYADDKTLSNEEAVKVFTRLMNVAANEIGCRHSHFVTPDGFHDDDHYTSAEDLARIAAYAKTIPLVSGSCKKQSASWELIHDESSTAPETSKSESLSSTEPEDTDISDDEEEPSENEMPEWMEWYNNNALILDDSVHYSPYADGMKTGYTSEAGTCVVASATIKGHTLIASVMDAPYVAAKYSDANELFKEGFKLYGLEYKFASEDEQSS